MAKPSQMGSTFAERAAARDGKSTFTDPTPKPGDAEENTTFAERAKAKGSKAVKAGDAEDKAVKSSSAKAK